MSDNENEGEGEGIDFDNLESEVNIIINIFLQEIMNYFHMRI